MHTGVKSLGCEKSTAHESPIHSWKLISPSVESAVKSGAGSLIVRAMCCLLPQRRERRAFESLYETAQRASTFHSSMRRHGAAVVPVTSAMSPVWGMSQARHRPTLVQARASGCRGASPQGASEVDPAPGSPSTVLARCLFIRASR